ncbi:hypothetical protein [Pararhizobium arenae]|nr:hypothetical protein [Pararhizobium arenae]
MRSIFIVLLGSVLSILAVKYANNTLANDVPMATPENAATTL